MTPNDVPFLWCALQATLLASLGIGAAWLYSRRAPAAGAISAAAAVTTIALVTIVMPVQVPQIALWPSSHPAEPASAEDSFADEESAASRAVSSVNGPSLDMGNLAIRMLNAMGAGGVAEKQRGRLIEIGVAGLFALGAAAGVLRFLAAMRFINRLRRDGTPVVDGETLRLFDELQELLAISRSVALCESPLIASPAVIGWRRPLVLLPKVRAGWTRDQLRATLAHELAHVARGDFLWRFVAGATQAIHFAHPLVHLLTRRLTLLQELATDRLAASAVGGSAPYLRALSELALRLDDKVRFRVEPIVLPTFSSNLMRRIAMLRSREGATDGAASGGSRQSRAGVVIASVIGIVGAATMAARGSADTAAPARGEAARAALFARAPESFSKLGGPGKGLFVVRVGELSQRAAFAPYVEALRASSRDLWPQVFKVEAPEFDLSAIEYVAGVPQLKVQAIEGDDPNFTGRMMVGAGEVIIRFSRDVTLGPWLEKFVPDAETYVDGTLTYYELPVIPMAGQVQLLVAAADQRTVVCTWGVDRMKEVIAGLADGSTASEAAQWKSLEGGLFTFVADDSHIDRDMSTPKAPLAQEVLKHVERYGVGFDLDPTTNQAGVRVAFSCADEGSASKVATALESLLPQMKAEIESHLGHAADNAVAEEEGKDGPMPPLSDAERAYMRFWIRALEACRVQVETSAGGVVCVVAATAEFPASLAGMQELAKRAPEPAEGLKSQVR